MNLYRKALLAATLLVGLAGCGSSPPATTVAAAAPDVQRGKLLYENNCNTCHTTQPHWRSQRLVGDWSDLVAQVTRWQGIASLHWTSEEIRDVAIFLNEQFYHLPCDVEVCGGPRASR
jgi:mono/diheme cytochrome c family protein